MGATTEPELHTANTSAVNRLKAERQATKANIADIETFFTEEAHERSLPGLRGLATQTASIPGIIPLSTGLPPANVFPLESIQLTLKGGAKIDINDPQEMMVAQQYNLTLEGYQPLLKWVEEHVHQLHGPLNGHKTVLSPGSNAVLEIIIKMFVEKGESALVEEFAYPHVPESMLVPMGIKTVPLKIDEHGIIPEAMFATLENLEAAGQPIPRLLYCVPTGQNPTGCVLPVERKEQIYAICRRFDILILEDDPYYYLQYEPGQPAKGVEGLGASFLSMDTDLRVIRADTFSKILLPGLRVGWVTAHPAVVAKYLYHLHGITTGVCPTSQVLMSALVNKLGHEGFAKQVMKVQEVYAKKAEVIKKAMHQHLTGLAVWTDPTAGMFLWMKLINVEDVGEIFNDLLAAKIIIVPGSFAWHAGPKNAGKCPYARISFATAPEEALTIGIERLAHVIRKHIADKQSQNGHYTA